MARIASNETLKASKKTRLTYAYRAMERDSLSSEPVLAKKADDAMERLGNMTKSEMLDWAFREKEYMMLND